MYLFQCIRFGSWKVRRLNRALGWNCLLLCRLLKRGTWGFTVLRYWAFSQAVFRQFWFLVWGIAVSSSPAVCSLSFFWLTVSGKRRSLDLTVNKYTISDSYSMMKLVGYPMTWLFDRCTDQFEIFPRFLAKAEVDIWCIHAWDKTNKQTNKKKHARWIQR